MEKQICLECQNNPHYLTYDKDLNQIKCQTCGGFKFISEFDATLQYIFNLFTYPKDLIWKHMTPERFLENLESMKIAVRRKE